MATSQQKPKVLQRPTAAAPSMSGIAHHKSSDPGNPILRLQSAIGNQAVQRLLLADPEVPVSPSVDNSHAGRSLQTKLIVNTPGDVHEQEADRIAEQVTRESKPQRRRVCSCGGECSACRKQLQGLRHDSLPGKHMEASDTGRAAAPHIQRFTGQAGGHHAAVPSIVDQTLSGPGAPLEPTLRQDMERRFGRDFRSVRVHTDSAADAAARALTSRAFTVGRDIVFRADRFAPGTREGRRLLAHELAHVVQQSGPDLGVDPNADRPHPVQAKPINSGAVLVQRDEDEEERKRKAMFGDFPLSPEVAASWGVPSARADAPKASTASPPSGNAHSGQTSTPKTNPGLPRKVKTISVLHFGTFGEHYVIAQLEEPSIQTAPDPVGGVNFDTYIVTKTRLAAAKSLGGTRYQVFMGSAECPGCHFGRGLEVDIGGENPITATLPPVLGALVPNPGGGPPPKPGIGVRLVKVGPSRPYDPNPVGPGRQLPANAGTPPPPAAPLAKAGPAALEPSPGNVQPPNPALPQLSTPTPAAPVLGSGGQAPRQLGPGPGPSLIVLDDATIKSLIEMWEGEIVKHPDRKADFERYIQNLRQRKNLLSSNRAGGVARSGEQSEKEAQFLTQSRQKQIKTSEGKSRPDLTVGNEWAGERSRTGIFFIRRRPRWKRRPRAVCPRSCRIWLTRSRGGGSDSETGRP